MLRNRAAAAEKLEFWDAVVADVGRALEVDAAAGEPVSVKALLRRAAAHERLGATAAAAADYRAAVELKPPNVEDLVAKLAALEPPASGGSKKKRKPRKK